MTREPLITLQRRLAVIGEIRAGEKDEKGRPRKLATWRLTSSDESSLAQAAERYGGKVSPWESPAGAKFQLTTERDELPVLIMPGYSLSQRYERWEGMTKRVRACDGLEEELSGEACYCNRADFVGVECDLYTRLTLALPELTTLLGWRLVSKGENAARELAGSLELASAVGRGSPFVPGRLRLSQRRGVVDGQTVRYVVPVLDFATGYAEIGGHAAVGAGTLVAHPGPAAAATFTPIAELNPGTSVETALEATARQAEPAARSARSAEPIGEAIAGVEPGAVPVEPDADGEKASEPKATPKPEEGSKPLLAKQKKVLDILVGRMRREETIRTDQIWGKVAEWRSIEAPLMVELLEGRDADGVLHWSPLRDSLTRAEADRLTGALKEFEAKTKEGAG